MEHGMNPDRLAGMDPLQRARYDVAVQRYHDTVAAHRATFESELRKARNAIEELHRRHDPKRAASESEAGTSRRRRRVPATSGPVQSILNKGG